MHLQELLKKAQIKIDIKKSEEFKFYKKNYSKYKSVLKYYNFHFNDTFSLILNTIIIKALNNKHSIEEEASKLIIESIKEKNYIDKDYINENIHEFNKMNNLPFFNYDNKELYVPIFSLSINNLYSYEQYKLFDKPNDDLLNKYLTYLIDLFEEYNFNLFDSNFTNLVKLNAKDDIIAFYHSDFKTLYFINKQGRLDYEVKLFDKYLENPDFNQIVIRLNDVVNAYLNSDKDKFINSLVNNKLISKKIIEIYQEKNRL